MNARDSNLAVVPAYACIVFWEPCVSPHKSAFFKAVADQNN